MMADEQLNDLATRLEKRAYDIRADGTRHCGPVSEKEAAIREADALLEEAQKIRAVASRRAE